jgi:hypothetical protein
MQPRRDGWAVFLAPEYVRARLRKLQGFMCATCVLGEMTHAGVDVSRQLDVAGRGGKAERAIEMPLREPIMARVAPSTRPSPSTPRRRHTRRACSCEVRARSRM